MVDEHWYANKWKFWTHRKRNKSLMIAHLMVLHKNTTNEAWIVSGIFMEIIKYVRKAKNSIDRALRV